MTCDGLHCLSFSLVVVIYLGYLWALLLIRLVQLLGLGQLSFLDELYDSNPYACLLFILVLRSFVFEYRIIICPVHSFVCVL